MLYGVKLCLQEGSRFQGAGQEMRGICSMIEKWTINYPAVGGMEARRAYVYLPPM